MDEISGIMIYYYFICHRKLWLYANHIGMEYDNELVRIGSVIDQTTYTRKRKHILIDNRINIDFVEQGIELHEVKKSKAIEIASIWQLKYYTFYLKNKGVNNILAKIDYPVLKKTNIR